jgi:hypothetical protein
MGYSQTDTSMPDNNELLRRVRERYDVSSVSGKSHTHREIVVPSYVSAGSAFLVLKNISPAVSPAAHSGRIYSRAAT